jgi:hypothetical protein
MFPYGLLQTHTVTKSRLLKYTVFLASKNGPPPSAEIFPHKSARILTPEDEMLCH